MRVLITNDDGVRAPGLLALWEALSELGETIAIAPDRPRSACGHAITLHKPLRVTPVEMPGVGKGFACSGTPVDCVALGTSQHLGGPPDLVVSGINLGPNLGQDMTYSGTVAGAVEAAICGLPSFAISVASYEAAEFGPAAGFARYLAEAVLARGLPPETFLNVNVPPAAPGGIAGVALTRKGTIRYDNRIESRTDPRGMSYYWLTGERVDHEDHPDTDVAAVAANRISVTPVSLDMTDRGLLADLKGWDLSWTG